MLQQSSRRFQRCQDEAGKEFPMADVHHPDTPRARGDYDAPHVSPVTPAEDARSIMLNKISWGAVLAGVVVALVVQLVLNLLGIGIGAATLEPSAGAADNPSATSFSVGAGLWFALAGIVASFAGGYAAGRLAGKPKESTAGWHGLTTWALTTLVVFYLLTTTVGGILGGAYQTFAGVLGNAASTVGSAAQGAAPGLVSAADPFSSIEQSIRGAAGGNDPAALRDAAVAAVRSALTGDQSQAQEARERAAEAVARAQNIPVEQARTEVQQYEQQYRQTLEQAKQQATKAADTAASAVSRGALFGALGLMLGAVGGWFGGRLGTVEPTITQRLGLSPTDSGPHVTTASPSSGNAEGIRRGGRGEPLGGA
jgi:hypothetical protein